MYSIESEGKIKIVKLPWKPKINDEFYYYGTHGIIIKKQIGQELHLTIIAGRLVTVSGQEKKQKQKEKKLWNQLRRRTENHESNRG
jgi:hypothetical protein|nr:MAG TPA: hypothetical protein [Caudoviricetes sp.]